MKNKGVVREMTLEEKASLMSGKNFWETKDIPRLGVQSVFLADGPHGVRKQIKGVDSLGISKSLRATCFPTASAMANSWNPDLGKEVAACIGLEAASKKVGVILGPGLNIKRNPLCGRNFEYFSEDPYLSGKMAAAYVQGLQSVGVAACPKHFAVNNQETRRMSINTVVDERTLREIYLTGFEMAVREGGTETIMTSYNRLNGIYANEHKHLLHTILRKEWGFEGVIMSDWGGNNDRVAALLAGSDLEMPATNGHTNLEVAEAVRAGEVPEECLDECADRVVTLARNVQVSLEKAEPMFDRMKHHVTAQRAAEESIVLLKNSNNILPLQHGARVAVIGDFAKEPRYQGAGSSLVNPTILESCLEIIDEFELEFAGYTPGFKRFGRRSHRLIKKALQLAARADVILLYLGLDESTETEGEDRKNIKLPRNQVELIKSLKKAGGKVVAVLACGVAVETDWDADTEALVHTYLGGQAGARAALNVITGLVNPSGKLAESFPHRYEDCSSVADFPGDHERVLYREGIMVGYRYFETYSLPVKYPFGFGLSYTTFEYSSLKVTPEGVRFRVKNTGTAGGAEIAQLYIGKKDSKIYRAAKELKGFKKVFLKAGESAVAEIPFDEYSFRYFNTKTNRWEIESGVYEIYIGASVADIRLNSCLKIKGTPHEPFGPSDFNELMPPQPCFKLKFVKKNRIDVDYNTLICDLRYAKGWTGRFFARFLRSHMNRYSLISGRPKKLSYYASGVEKLPLRGLTRMSLGLISWGQLDGLIMMFNGHFFKGLKKFRRESRIKKQARREEKKRLKRTVTFTGNV